MGNTEELRKIAVDEHNKYRRRHGVPPLKGDDDKIHNVAQRYAEYLASYDLFQHSNNSPYGENLAGALGDNEAEAIRYAVKMWYDEIKCYNYGCPGFSMGTGHFTQVVWKSSVHLGIGVAYNSRKRWWIVVGNYSPPGNYQGRFPENVPRLLSANELKKLEEEEEKKEAEGNEEDNEEESSSSSESEGEDDWETQSDTSGDNDDAKATNDSEDVPKKLPNNLWQVAVGAHNKYRRLHGVPPIKGDDETIHNVAQKYAEYLAGYNLFQHSNNRSYGENLAGALGEDKEEAIKYAVKMWYDEVKCYNYGCPGFSMATGHFTQVVWKSSTHVGIGVAYNSYQRWWVVVGNYSPPGNYQGRFPENVPRLLSSDELKKYDEKNKQTSKKEEFVNEISSESDSEEAEEKSSKAPKKLKNELWQVAVDEHNKYRKLHGVPLVEGDDETIHHVAQNYANQLSNTNCIQHSGNRSYGENIAATTADDGKDAIQKAVKMWYDESSKYNYNNPGFTCATGHFTQIVWKTCRKIGVGAAYNQRMRWWIVVVNYCPQGNVMTQFGDNVPRPVPKGASSSTKKQKSEASDGDVTEKFKDLKVEANASDDDDDDKGTGKLKNELWQIAVEEHNKYRRRHGVNDIKGDNEKIHQTAQQYAEYLAGNNLFQHSRTNYGENLAGALGSNEKEAIRSAVKMWYDEVRQYNFHRQGFASGTGHFTQVVWAGSTHVGIGVAYNPRKRWWVVVANYSPAGNVMGRFPQNVFPCQN